VLVLFGTFILSPNSSHGKTGSSAFQARDVVKRGAVEVGVLTGYHQALDVLTSDSANRGAVHVLPRVGIVLTDELGGGLLSGNIELLGEILYAHHVKPFSAEAAGGSLGIKYNLLSFGRWMPYWGVGAGMLWTNLAPRISEQSTPFNFVLRSGPGIQYFLTDRVVPTFDAGFYHVSNARHWRPQSRAERGLSLHRRLHHVSEVNPRSPILTSGNQLWWRMRKASSDQRQLARKERVHE
jgi:hypothetical protein